MSVAEPQTLSLTQRKMLEALAAGRSPHFDGPHKKTLGVLFRNKWVRYIPPPRGPITITELGREVLTWPPVMWRKP